MEEKGGMGRWLLFAAGIAILMFTLPRACQSSGGAQPITMSTVLPAQRAPERLCDLWGQRFHAQLTTQGAALRSFRLTTAKYKKQGEPIELGTTPDHEQHRQLFFNFRNPAVAGADDKRWNVAYDSVDWKLVQSNGKTCVFEYADERVRLRKVVSVTERAYELDVTASIKNLAAEKLRDRKSVV